MLKILPFKEKRGQILVEEDYITVFFADNVNESRKFPMFRVIEKNIELLHQVLKLANLGEYFITDEALELFDKLVAEWKAKDGTY